MFVIACGEEPDLRRRAEYLSAAFGVSLDGSVHSFAAVNVRPPGHPPDRPRSPQATPDFLLAVTPQRLELRSLGRRAPGPVYVDFLHGANGRLRRLHGGKNQPLARAVGLRDSVPTVIDATAGLGRDAFHLALLGCRVVAVERSPVLAALFRDGLDRAAAELDPALLDRLTLIHADARRVLADGDESTRPDVVYLDPMYPPRRHAAEAPKEMRILRRLVGHDLDAADLLTVARTVARRRVVVKRPRLAPPLGPDPDLVHRGKIARYDVYLTHARETSSLA